MTATVANLSTNLERALLARLSTVAPYFGLASPADLDANPAEEAGRLVELIATELSAHPINERIWLALAAVAAAYPSISDVDRVRRCCELNDGIHAATQFLDAALDLARSRGSLLSSIDIVTGAVVVDVDHTAKFDLHTGIQTVCRSLMPIWSTVPQVIASAWTSRDGALRRLSAEENQRVYQWWSRASDVSAPASDDGVTPSGRTVIVPWHSVVVATEVATITASERLAAIGNYSPNRFVVISHDAIPVASADLVPPTEVSKFTRFLSAVKYANRVACVSQASADELRGFVTALAAQGLPGPSVVAVPLGSLQLPERRETRPNSVQRQPVRDPDILVVGSHEPRKNHLAILQAAEVLWREGLAFSLTFIGGSGWGDTFPTRAEELQHSGRPLTVLKAVSNEVLETAYQEAAFTVFPSLQEGFGLPVAESLAFGTPVITSNFGSTLETAQGGGVVVVDPRDDGSLTDAMRSLLTQPERLASLRQQIQGRPVRLWDDYGTDLWDALIAPELSIANTASTDG